MKKILIVFGTRPEAIKMAPVVREFQNNPDQFNVKVCVTAQHREMLDQVLEIFDIKPEYDLNLMKKGQDLFDITARVITEMKSVLDDFKPDFVFVHGDTTTSASAALASFYSKIPVAHVEAGLRTFNIYSPWPEEMNRQITGRIAELNFAPTKLSAENLIKENISPDKIIITGNTVIDALHIVKKRVDKDPGLNKKIKNLLSEQLDNKLDIDKDRFILVTGHRRENFGQGFINICEALNEISKKFENIHIIYPVHLNPNVREPVYKILKGRNNIHLIDPIEYLPFVFLMSRSYFVLTDSGGIQEEAPGLGKPVLVMRDTTERPEAVQAGTVVLVGTDKKRIIKEASDLIENNKFYEKMSKAHNPYGDGKASERIIKTMMSLL